MKMISCKIDHFTNPLGAALPSLSISWKVAESQGTRAQWSKIEVQKAGESLWDSGEASLDSLGTCLPIALTPRTAYAWRVTVCTDAGEMASSDWNTFETGKMDEPWQAKWLGAPRGKAPVFRRIFEVPDVPQDARLYITGLGLYEASVNGQKVGDEYLTPGCTLYPDRVQVHTFDVKKYLTLGENVLEVCLADGWYMGRFGLAEQGCAYGDHYALLAELHVGEQVIGTDADWLVADSAVTSPSLYDGENWDPGAKMDWQPAVLLPKEQHPLCDRTGPAVRVQRELPAKALLHTPCGQWVLDFGQNMSGFVRFACDAPKGHTVRLLYGEWMQEGELYRKNLGTAKQTFTYVSDGEARMVGSHFGCYGFRYVLVEGIESPRLEDFIACALWSDMEDAGMLDFHQPMLNKLVENIQWGQRSNYVDVPTDCPQRAERLGWTADAQVFAPTALYLTDAAAFLNKYVADLRLEQTRRGGAAPIVVPAFGEESVSSFWSDAAAFMPWMLYEATGDLAMLRCQYPGMKAWVDWVIHQDEQSGNTHLWRGGFHFGDWLGLDNEDQGSFKGGTPDDYIASACYYRSASLTAKAALALGYNEDAICYGNRARAVLDALQKEYFTAAGRLAVTTQCGYALALAWQLCPPGTEKRCADALADKLKAVKTHLRTGFVGTSVLCRALSENGYHDLAVALLLQEDYPSWLYAVKLGATTVWERWNSVNTDGQCNEVNMNSLNHYSYGCVAEWMYADLAGLRPLAPGFRKAALTPRPHWRLSRLDMAYLSAVGEYRVAWRVDDAGGLALDVTVPFGAEAELTLPGSEVVVHLTAGTYHYQYKPARPIRQRFDLATALSDMEANEKCRMVLSSFDIDPQRVPAPMHNMPLAALLNTPFAALPGGDTQELLKALEAL